MQDEGCACLFRRVSLLTLQTATFKNLGKASRHAVGSKVELL